VERAVLSWLDAFIIGLDMCPFARGARRGTRVAVSRAPATVEGALEELWAEMRVLDGALAAQAAAAVVQKRASADADAPAVAHAWLPAAPLSAPATTLFVLTQPFAEDWDDFMSLHAHAEVQAAAVAGAHARRTTCAVNT
jgi:hypothetical protein